MTTSCARCGKAIRNKKGSLPPGRSTCQSCRRVIREQRKADRQAALIERREAAARRRALPKPVKILAPKVCPVCKETFVPWRTTQVYCTPEHRELRAHKSGPKSSPASRGYGAAHNRERAKWKPRVEAGHATCCLCGEPIKPGSKWHLDHTPDRSGYRGVAHASCNTSDGATRGNRARAHTSRRWNL